MSTTLSDITKQLSHLKLDDSLLYLNHILNVSRGYSSDPFLEPKLVNEKRPAVLPHVVHFIAKQLLLNASNLGTRTLDWDDFQRLSQMHIHLEDPISSDPNWKTGNPDHFFARALAQQLPAQARNHLQKYGLALGLFRDVGTVNFPEPFDLKSAVESEIEMPIETFMSMGQTLLALKAANHNGIGCMGAFTHATLTQAFSQGIEFCVPEIWTPFLDRVSCTRDEFRAIADKAVYKSSSGGFEPFSFNPLALRPIVNLGEDRYLSVDPELLIERVTFGLFHDLFAKHKMVFTERFGFAFEAFVGQLLCSGVSEDLLWSASKWEDSTTKKKENRKLCDWIYQGSTASVLFECKSLRPSLRLTTYGDERSLNGLNIRIAKAVTQLSRHSKGINDGAWSKSGLSPAADYVGVIVTYRKLYTANDPFCRDHVAEILAGTDVEPIPYIVLSIEDLDSVVRLLELGHPLDGLVSKMVSESPCGPLTLFRRDLEEVSLSLFTLNKAQKFLDGIVSYSGDG